MSYIHPVRVASNQAIQELSFPNSAAGQTTPLWLFLQLFTIISVFAVMLQTGLNVNFLHLLENCVVARATILQNLLFWRKVQKGLTCETKFKLKMQKFQFLVQKSVR